jgi:hypothetical protein
LFLSHFLSGVKHRKHNSIFNFVYSNVSGIFVIMNISIKILILSFFLSTLCSEVFSDSFLMKLSVYSFENSQPGKGSMNETDSPVCLDSDSNDILYFNPKSSAGQTSFHSDPVFLRDLFQLSAYSFFIWQPPKTA